MKNKPSGTVTILLLVIALATGSCATAWRTNGTYYKTVKTRLAVDGEPTGKVFVNGRHRGDLPADVPLEYERKIETRTRKVSYWQTDPGTAFLFTIASLGVYLPFSIFPVDTESLSVPLDSFRDNRFTIVVDAGERGKWTKELVLAGEEEVRIQPALRPLFRNAITP